MHSAKYCENRRTNSTSFVATLESPKFLVPNTINSFRILLSLPLLGLRVKVGEREILRLGKERRTKQGEEDV